MSININCKFCGGDRMQEQIILLELDEEYVVPDNCWAFVEQEDGTKKLVQATTVRGSEVQRLVLIPKVAGG